jgi:hypothetical protein
MSILIRGLRALKRQPRLAPIPTIAEAVAGCRVPAFGLDGEALDMRFVSFSHSQDAIDFLFQRPAMFEPRPGLRISSRAADGEETERYLDVLIRAAAQSAALDFGTQAFREKHAPRVEAGDPFAMLDEFPLAGQDVPITLGDGWRGRATVWQWRLPQPLRALAINHANPLIIASYDLTTEQLVPLLAQVVPVRDRPALIQQYQRAFDERMRDTNPHYSGHSDA